MSFFDQYLQRSQEIIGDRTPAEKRYDNEVLRWLRKGKNIKKAIEKANKKCNYSQGTAYFCVQPGLRYDVYAAPD